MNPVSSLQLMLTRRCQLRCLYCPIVKRDSDMTAATLDRAVDLLFTSPARELRLDFTGGEPFLRPELVRRAVLRAERLARSGGKQISFYAVTNGLALDQDMLQFLRGRDILLELSLDGGRRRHNHYKRAAQPGVDAYAGTTAAVRAAAAAGLDHFAVMVATPSGARGFYSDFSHIYSLGVRRFDINYALGLPWTPAALAALKSSFARICLAHAAELRSGALRLGNFDKRSEPALLNSEIMVNTDGGLHTMSEWMFENSCAPAPAPLPLGTVRTRRSLRGLTLSKAAAYYTLLSVYGADPRVRAVIRNNIDAGRAFSAFVGALKAKLFAGGVAGAR